MTIDEYVRRWLPPIAILALCSCRTVTETPAPPAEAGGNDATTDASVDVISEDCRFEGGVCTTGCGCGSVQGPRIDLERKCREPAKVFGCRASGGCTTSELITCYFRSAADGGLDVFEAPGRYSGGQLIGFEMCSETLTAEVQQITAPCP